MDELFSLLIIAFFILAPLLEKILKRGRGAQDELPPVRRQPQRPPQTYQRRSETLEQEEAAGEGSAAEMLPDDLWAILTGETRPPRQEPPPEPVAPEPPPPVRQPPQRPSPRAAERRPLPSGRLGTRPRPLPQRPAPVPRLEDEAAADEELVAYRPPPPPERFERVEYAPQDFVREIPRHEPPLVVSMETPLERDEVRHGRFHERLARLAPPETVRRGPAREAVGLHNPDELRRAVILTEILGPPRGLE